MNALRIPSFMPILQHFSFFGNGLNAFFQIYAARQNTPAGYYITRAGVLFGKRNEARYRLRLIPFSFIQTLCSLQRAWKGLQSPRKYWKAQRQRTRDCPLHSMKLRSGNRKGENPSRLSMQRMKFRDTKRNTHSRSLKNHRPQNDNYPSRSR